MKNKFQFIIPRLLVLTAVVGIVTILIGTIFKILLVTTILFSIGMLIYSKIKKRQLMSAYPAILANQQEHPSLNKRAYAVVPVKYASRTSKATIVPIY